MEQILGIHGYFFGRLFSCELQFQFVLNLRLRSARNLTNCRYLFKIKERTTKNSTVLLAGAYTFPQSLGSVEIFVNSLKGGGHEILNRVFSFSPCLMFRSYT